MKTAELAEKLGLSRQRISKLIQGLTEGVDYTRQMNKFSQLVIDITPAGVEKIESRNTEHFSDKSGRPRKHPEKKKTGQRGRPKGEPKPKAEPKKRGRPRKVLTE